MAIPLLLGLLPEFGFGLNFVMEMAFLFLAVVVADFVCEGTRRLKWRHFVAMLAGLAGYFVSISFQYDDAAVITVSGLVLTLFGVALYAAWVQRDQNRLQLIMVLASLAIVVATVVWDFAYGQRAVAAMVATGDLEPRQIGASLRSYAVILPAFALVAAVVLAVTPDPTRPTKALT